MALYDMKVPIGAPFAKPLSWRTPELDDAGNVVRDANGQIVYQQVNTTTFDFQWVVFGHLRTPVLTNSVAHDGAGHLTITATEDQTDSLKSNMTYRLNVLQSGAVIRKLLYGAVVPV